MKSLLLFPLLLCLSAQDPDYAKLLKDSKISMSDAIDAALKEVKGGTATGCTLKANDDGKTRFFVEVSKDKQLIEVEVDAVKGEVAGKETHEEDESKAVEAAKISLKKALEIALKKVSGKAVYADLDFDDKGTIEVEVDVFSDGKVTKVYIDAKSGDILRTDPK